MNNYIKIEKLNSGVFNATFDLKSFIKFQEQIALKYQTKEELMFENVGSKSFINNYDRYLLHCIEEISEVRDAIINNHPTHDIHEEFADVLMYLGTMTAIIGLNMERYELSMKDDMRLSYLVHKDHYNGKVLFDNEQKPVLNSTMPVTIDLRLMEIVHLLIEERRLFPQRKWHKPSANDSELQFKFKLNKMYSNNLRCMEIIIQLLLEDKLCKMEYINEIINRKEMLVLNLPLPE